MFPCYLQDWPLLLLIRELRGSPRHFPVKPSPLNEWQATSPGVGSGVTQQLFGNRRFVTCAGFRDVASLKTKATFKSEAVYLGQWYPRDNLRDIGDGRQAAGHRGSEPGCAKRDGPRVCRTCQIRVLLCCTECQSWTVTWGRAPLGLDTLLAFWEAWRRLAGLCTAAWTQGTAYVEGNSSQSVEKQI